MFWSFYLSKKCSRCWWNFTPVHWLSQMWGKWLWRQILDLCECHIRTQLGGGGNPLSCHKLSYSKSPWARKHSKQTFPEWQRAFFSSPVARDQNFTLLILAEARIMKLQHLGKCILQIKPSRAYKTAWIQSSNWRFHSYEPNTKFWHRSN